jgi:hypothetical protein
MCLQNRPVPVAKQTEDDGAEVNTPLEVAAAAVPLDLAEVLLQRYQQHMPQQQQQQQLPPKEEFIRQLVTLCCVQRGEKLVVFSQV